MAREETHVYRDFNIHFWAPPIPDRRWDWHYAHKDIDLDDDRCGDCASLEAAKAEINEWYLEQEESK